MDGIVVVAVGSVGRGEGVRYVGGRFILFTILTIHAPHGQQPAGYGMHELLMVDGGAGVRGDGVRPRCVELGIWMDGCWGGCVRSIAAMAWGPNNASNRLTPDRTNHIAPYRCGWRHRRRCQRPRWAA